MQLGSTNINTTLVANTLETSSRDVGSLCKHANVNKWSLYKPISVAKTSGLTDLDYYNNDFGYNIQSYNNYQNMKLAISQDNYLWYYIKPTGGASSPFRIGDFRKYDHKSLAPFEMTILSDEVRINGTVSISVPNEIQWLTNWDQWSGYQGASMQYLNCGVYVPGIGYYPFTDTDQGLSLGDLDSSKLNFTITDAFTAHNTYTCYLILTTWDGLNGARQWYNPAENEGGTWWILATENPPSFRVLPELTPLDYLRQSITNASTQYHEETTTFTNTRFTATYSLSGDYVSLNDWELYVNFYVDNIVSGQSTRSVLIGSMGSDNFSKDNPCTKTIIYNNPLERLTGKDEVLSIRAEISVQDPSHTHVYNTEKTIQIEGTII